MIVKLIDRRKKAELQRKLKGRSAVALLGQRQTGKTTLAKIIVDEMNGVYLDCQDRETSLMLGQGGLRSHVEKHDGRLIVLDEIQRQANLFPELRGLIDERRRQDRGNGCFLLLGSAAIRIANKSEESLGGRISYVNLEPLDVLEMQDGSKEELDRLWLRGGLPPIFTAPSDADSFEMLEDLIQSMINEEMIEEGMRVGYDKILTLATVLAHRQGLPLNVLDISRIVEVNERTAKKFIERLSGLLVVRMLRPYYQNFVKRLKKTPKFYYRDSGMLHNLIGVRDAGTMDVNALAGMSWEGFVIENILRQVPAEVENKASFYGAVGGAEIDLVIEKSDVGLWAIEIKKNLNPTLSKGFHSACQDLNPARRFVVHGGRMSFKDREGVENMSLPDMCREVAAAFTL